MNKGLFRDDAVCANGEGNDHVVINHKQHPVTVGEVKVENLVAVPKEAFELVNVEGGVSPVILEQAELGARDSLDFRRERAQFTFETNRATEGHGSSSISSGSSYSRGSMGSFSWSLVSRRSLAVGLRAGTVAAKRTASNGASSRCFPRLLVLTGVFTESKTTPANVIKQPS